MFACLNAVNSFRIIIRNCIKMSSIQRIKENAELAKQTIQDLKNELSFLNTEYNNLLANQLRDENAKLLVAVEEAKARLVQLEIKNGIKQISLPNQLLAPVVIKQSKQAEESPQCNKQEVSSESKLKKEKKHKEVTPSAELPVHVGRLDLRIAKIEDVQRHPDADTLYLLRINCGEDKPRTVCSGLVKHIALEELKERMVMLLCNLKPVKMRGVTSAAMVMCASCEKGVEVLIPPPGCTPGELVHCEGYIRQPDLVMNPKKKIFETVAPDLHTDGELRACYKGVPLMVPDKGPIMSKTLANVPVK